MWINFVNLNGGDVEQFVKGNEPRETAHILCEALGVVMYCTTFGKVPGFVIKVNAKYGSDPKIHFTDEQKANDHYHHLAKMIASHNESDFVQVDVLAQGAL